MRADCLLSLHMTSIKLKKKSSVKKEADWQKRGTQIVSHSFLLLFVFFPSIPSILEQVPFSWYRSLDSYTQTPFVLYVLFMFMSFRLSSTPGVLLLQKISSLRLFVSSENVFSLYWNQKLYCFHSSLSWFSLFLFLSLLYSSLQFLLWLNPRLDPGCLLLSSVLPLHSLSKLLQISLCLPPLTAFNGSHEDLSEQETNQKDNRSYWTLDTNVILHLHLFLSTASCLVLQKQE